MGLRRVGGSYPWGVPPDSSLGTSFERLPKVPASADEISRRSRTSWAGPTLPRLQSDVTGPIAVAGSALTLYIMRRRVRLGRRSPKF